MHRPAYRRPERTSMRTLRRRSAGQTTGARPSVTRLLFEALDMVGYLLDPHGCVAECFHGSAAARAVTRGRPFEEAFRVDNDQGSVAEQSADMLKAVQSGDARTQSLEYEVHAHGRDEWRCMTIVPVPGHPGWTIVLDRDVTADRGAELALDRIGRRYALAGRVAQLAIWDCNLESGEVSVDPGLKSLLGYLEREITDTLEGWQRLIIPEDLEQFVTRWTEHLAGVAPLCEVELRVRRRDGGVRWFLMRGMLVERTRGRPLRAVGTVMDITERKRAEAAAAAATAASRRRKRTVRRLALELLHAQQAERRRIGEELHDDICQRIAALEISLGNTLRQSVLDRGEIEATREHLARLSADVRRLSHDMNPPEVSRTDLVSRLRAHIDELSRIGQLDVQLEAGNMPSDLTDDAAQCLYRIAQEALSNIARHACTRSARVALRSTGDDVALAIIDAGRGFDAEASDAGVGLASMRRRIERLNGRLEIASAPGRGTTITAWLPCARDSRRRWSRPAALAH